MEYIGIDLHKRNFVACVVNEAGTTLHTGKYKNSHPELIKLLANCSVSPKVVLEATLNWRWMVRALQKLKLDITLAHPLKTKAIASARIKTDELDAQTLANLLRGNLVPASYIPTPQEQADRDLARARCQLVKQQTWIKNQIHGLLTKENLISPVTDLFGKKGRDWLADQPLPDNSRLIVNQWLLLLSDTQDRILDLEKQIKDRVKDDRRAQIIESIPGLGVITAFVLASEIGDPQRFSTGEKMAAYFGLVPSLYQSGKTKRQGSITKLGNPYVRWVLVQSAHRLVRMNTNYNLFYQTLSARRGKKRAIVAVARKLCLLSWKLLTDNRKYKKVPPRKG
jgi:transposase